MVRGRVDLWMKRPATPPPLLRLSPARACACGCECAWSVAGWWWLVVVVGSVGGRTNTPRHPLILNLNGLGVVRPCL